MNDTQFLALICTVWIAPTVPWPVGMFTGFVFVVATLVLANRSMK